VKRQTRSSHRQIYLTSIICCGMFTPVKPLFPVMFDAEAWESGKPHALPPTDSALPPDVTMF
jgi:hypothetical protein